MTLSTPRFLALGVLAGLALAPAAQAQQAPRYIFPNTAQGRVLALSNGQVLLASAANGSRVLRLHWLNAQGDTVRGRRIVLPSAVGVRSLTANMYTSTALVNCGSRVVLLSAQGDTLWTRPVAVPTLVTGTPDGGFVGLEDDTHPTRSMLAPKWVKFSATGQKVSEVFLPYPSSVDQSYSLGIVPAANGCWAMAMDASSTGPRWTSRVVYISDAGTIGAQQTLSGVGYGKIVALPNPADGYLVLADSRGLQRFSPAWVPQWPAPVAGYDGLRVAPDGNALTFAQGPYARIPEAPLVLSVGVGQITAAGQSLYRAVVDQQVGYDGVGLDIAKNTTGSLVVHTVQRYTGTNTPSLLVYALPATALATRARTEAPALAVYPQPATGTVTIRTAGLQGELALLDGLGRVVRQLPVEAGKTEQQLPLQGLAAGIYVLRATDKAGQVLTTRVSKQ